MMRHPLMPLLRGRAGLGWAGLGWARPAAALVQLAELTNTGYQLRQLSVSNPDVHET